MRKYENRGIGGSSRQSKLIFLHIYITEFLYHMIWYLKFFSVFLTGKGWQKERPEMYFWKRLIGIDSYLISQEIQIFKEQWKSGVEPISV